MVILRLHSGCYGSIVAMVTRSCLFFFFFFFFHVQPYNRKYRSIGHRVWSMSLNILTELSVNLSEPSAQSVIVIFRPELTPVAWYLELPYS